MADLHQATAALQCLKNEMGNNASLSEPEVLMMARHVN